MSRTQELHSRLPYTELPTRRDLWVSSGLETGAFEMVKTDLWRVYIPESRWGLTFEQIYINEERRFPAQTPNRGEFFRFENIKFHTAGYLNPAKGYESPQATCNIEATVMLDNVEDISFIGCDIAHTGLHAI